MVVPSDAHPDAQHTFEKQWGGASAASVKLTQVTQVEEYREMIAWIPQSMEGGVERVIWGWREVLFPAKVQEFGVVTGEEGRDMRAVYNDMLAVLEKEFLLSE